MNQRRPLVQHGGPIRSAGPSAMRDLLVRALESAANTEADTLTHGFHTWTARLHPAIAGVVIDSLTARGGAVLDPFSGSGTVVLEAMVAGRVGIGADLNPLAALLGRVKTQRRSPAACARLREALRDVAARSEDRVRARVPVIAKIPKSVAHEFDGHILKELAGLYEELCLETNTQDREAMQVVFSSILVKMSRRLADSTPAHVEKSLRKGLVTELFLRKGLELVDRFAELAEAIPDDSHAPRFFVEDVRSLASRFAKAPPFDLVLTSPPYGGTYDYATHHSIRFAFLGLDPYGLEEGELGARRRSNEPDALLRWNDETRGYLGAIRRVVAREGHVVLIVGDAWVDGQHIPAVDHLDAMGRDVGLGVVAAASEPRVGLTGRVREEHLVWMQPVAEAPRSREPDRGPPIKPSRSPVRPSRGSDAGDSASSRPRGPSRPSQNRGPRRG